MVAGEHGFCMAIESLGIALFPETLLPLPSPGTPDMGSRGWVPNPIPRIPYEAVQITHLPNPRGWGYPQNGVPQMGP